MSDTAAATGGARRLLHTREVVCKGYVREDGLFDVEASLRDISPEGTDLYFKQVDAGGLLHGLRLTMTIDADMQIVHMQAHSDTVPTPWCSESSKPYDQLVGLRIGPGFTQRMKERVGGRKGCTHLTELISPLATTAVQTVMSLRRETRDMAAELQGTGPMPRPVVYNTCHTYRQEGQAIKVIWPEHRRAVVA